MAFVYKILGQSSPDIGTLTEIYRVPENNSTILSTITVANRDTDNIFYSLYVQKSGAEVGDSNQYISFNTTVVGSDTASLTLGITLGANDAIGANVTGNVSINAFGTEITP